MNNKQLLNRPSIGRETEAGFTLVELAIVMIIIGLLIGGVLKGQELISNAQVSSTVAQIKNIDSGVNTFRDSYQSFPGDMTRVVARVANCAGCVAGNGNGVLTEAVDLAAVAGEAIQFWRHLNAADMVAGVDSSTNAALWGAGQPATSIGGGLTIGYTATGAAGVATGLPLASLPVRAGHYLTLRSLPTAAAGPNMLSPAQAFRLDNKLDNGSPHSGTTVAAGGAGAAACSDLATVAGVYNEALGQQLCSLYIRIQ